MSRQLEFRGGVKLQAGKLQVAKLWVAKLQVTKLQAGKLQEAKLQVAKLQAGKLQVAKLQVAKLQVAKLQVAKLKAGKLQAGKVHADSFLEIIYALLHHHLFINHGGHWGTTDDFITSFLHFFLCSLHCPLGLGELHASPFSDVVFPPLPLSALSFFCFHCALQDGFGQT